MPITTALTWVKQQLAGLPIPGMELTLDATVDPYDPQVEQVNPTAYIWATTGPEKRQSMPRPATGTPQTGSTQAGWKEMDHHVDIFVIWFRQHGDPFPDIAFPVIMDAIEDALRCSQDPVTTQDPVTYRYSQLYGLGENMTYDMAPPEHTTADQRTLIYRGRVLGPVHEEFQA